jgi:hypothetical protein
MENNNIAKIYDIYGIYGSIEHLMQSPKQNEDKISYDCCERDIKTGEKISVSEDINGLPDGITKDDYFKMALLKVLGEIRDEIRKDSYVNIKSPSINIDACVDEAVKKLVSTLDKNSTMRF